MCFIYIYIYIYIYDLHRAALHKRGPPQAPTNTSAARDKVPGAISAELIQRKWKLDQPPIFRSNCMIPKACPQLLRLFFFVGVEAQLNTHCVCGLQFRCSDVITQNQLLLIVLHFIPTSVFIIFWKQVECTCRRLWKLSH
jgi:hypothetical protein